MKSFSKLITGLPPEDPEEKGPERPTLPRLRTFWVTYFDHKLDKVNEVTVSAHEVQVVSTGMLIFTAHAYTDDPAFEQANQPPVITRYVRAFKDFMGFGEIYNTGSVS